MIKIDIEKNNGNVEVILHLGKQKWNDLILKAKNELMDNLELKGFRKGKVPKNIAEKNISQSSVLNKAVDKALNDHYEEAMEKIKDERIVSRPEIMVVKLSEDEAVLKIVSSLFPEINLGEYKNITNVNTNKEICI